MKIYLLFLLLFVLIHPWVKADDVFNIEDEFLKPALEASATGRDQEALNYMDLLNRVRPDDPDTWYYMGLALNRVGDFAGAKRWLLRVPATDYPQLALELGWARLETGELLLAQQNFETYLELNPEHAKATEYLGRTLYRLGQTDEAERVFQNALKLDVTLSPSVNAYLAGIANRKGDSALATRYLSLSVVHPMVPFLEVAQPEKKTWVGELSLQVGYDTNAIALADTEPLPSGVSGQAGDFLLLGAGVTHSTDYDAGQLQFNFTGFAQYYESDLSAIDSVVNQLGVSWLTDFSALSAYYQYSTLDRDSFRNQGVLEYSQWFPTTSGWIFEVTPSVFYDQYAGEPPQPELDRDGWQPGVLLASHLPLINQNATLSLGIEGRVNDKEGSDYDSDVGRVFIGTQALIRNYSTLLAYFYWTREDYTQPNTLSPTGAKRQDTIQQYIIELNIPVIKHNLELSDWEFFVRFSGTRQNSNIAVFSYDQDSVSGGLRLLF